MTEASKDTIDLESRLIFKNKIQKLALVSLKTKIDDQGMTKADFHKAKSMLNFPNEMSDVKIKIKQLT